MKQSDFVPFLGTKMELQPDKLHMFEKQRNTAKHTKARPYIFIMYYNNHIMLTGENKTQTGKSRHQNANWGGKISRVTKT